MRLWIVFSWGEDGKHEFEGVFSSKTLAIAACVRQDMCVCPCVLDERVPEGEKVWPGAWYPHMESEPSLPDSVEPQ